MRLRWRAGVFTQQGACWYQEASSPRGKWTISKACVCGEFVYLLWFENLNGLGRNKPSQMFHNRFSDSASAKALAEELEALEFEVEIAT